ncbi:MAG: L-rhamnose mutarotase [Treponemataceae bacterium]
MPRNAFAMKLKPGCAAEYEARHNRIWPELVAEMKAAGISRYSIFIDESSSTLFAVRTVNSESAAQALKDKEIMRRWWDYMSDLMETNADKSPVSVPLREIFYLE